jgi:hypothetical protein
MGFEIDSAAKRARLLVRKNPYWCAVAGGRGGVSLGYRRRRMGAGTWVAKIVVDGKRFEERIGDADDASAPSDAVPYRPAVARALEWSTRQHAVLDAGVASGGARRPTVRTAVDEYTKVRTARSERDGKIREGRLNKHVLADEEFAEVRLAKLRVGVIEEWKERLLAADVADRGEERITPCSMTFGLH